MLDSETTFIKERLLNLTERFVQLYGFKKYNHTVRKKYLLYTNPKFRRSQRGNSQNQLVEMDVEQNFVIIIFSTKQTVFSLLIRNK